MAELVELRENRDRRLFTLLMERYHSMGMRAGLSKGRYFVYVVDGYWVAGAYIQPPDPFIKVFKRFNLDTGRSYFLRRIAKFCPGDYLLDLLNALSNRLRAEGKELLVTMGLPKHSNALYKKAGFVEVGRTRSGRPVFVLRLR